MSAPSIPLLQWCFGLCLLFGKSRSGGNAFEAWSRSWSCVEDASVSHGVCLAPRVSAVVAGMCVCVCGCVSVCLYACRCLRVAASASSLVKSSSKNMLSKSCMQENLHVNRGMHTLTHTLRDRQVVCYCHWNPLSTSPLPSLSLAHITHTHTRKSRLYPPPSKQNESTSSTRCASSSTKKERRTRRMCQQ